MIMTDYIHNSGKDNDSYKNNIDREMITVMEGTDKNDNKTTATKIAIYKEWLQGFWLQYIPRNMHTVLLCFALLWLCNRSKWIQMNYSSIFIRVALLALGQSSDCHSASEVSLMDMGKSVST